MHGDGQVLPSGKLVHLAEERRMAGMERLGGDADGDAVGIDAAPPTIHVGKGFVQSDVHRVLVGGADAAIDVRAQAQVVQRFA